MMGGSDIRKNPPEAYIQWSLHVLLKEDFDLR